MRTLRSWRSSQRVRLRNSSAASSAPGANSCVARRTDMSRKTQITNYKSQTSSKSQVPIHRARLEFRHLEFGTCLDFVIWNLGFSPPLAQSRQLLQDVPVVQAIL